MWAESKRASEVAKWLAKRSCGCCRCMGRIRWTWLHKFRRAMVRPGRNRLVGRVEEYLDYYLDETGGPHGRVCGRSRRGAGYLVGRETPETSSSWKLDSRPRRRGEYLLKLRWPEFRRAMGQQTRPGRTAGTIFQDTRKPLTLSGWLRPGGGGRNAPVAIGWSAGWRWTKRMWAESASEVAKWLAKR